jgi:hypothetical protein
MLAQSNDLSLLKFEFSHVNKDIYKIRDSVTCHPALGRFALVTSQDERLSRRDTSPNCGRIFRALFSQLNFTAVMEGRLALNLNILFSCAKSIVLN